MRSDNRDGKPAVVLIQELIGWTLTILMAIFGLTMLLCCG